MRKKIYLLWGIMLWSAVTVCAQKKNTSYRFYGQIRGDLFYNSRANAESVDGLFHLYPEGHAYDPAGNDRNATPNGSLYLLYTRLGLGINGPDIGRAKTTATLETDFRGSGSNWAVLRIRHAYVRLDWGKSAVLVGQTWHPLFGEVFPQMLNLSTGAPFQPFNRSPQIRYTYASEKGWQLTGAALWQLQYLSIGPKGKSEEYIKNSCIPEIYLSADWKKKDLIAGAGIEILSLKPRTLSEKNDRLYKVNERVTSLSMELHAKYTSPEWQIAGKTLWASNLTQVSMPGGYAVTEMRSETGEQRYTPYRHSSTWLNVVYGKKWKPGIFAGFLKNLGTGKPIVGTAYGRGIDVDTIWALHLQLSYNLPHWKLGAEYAISTARYGTSDLSNGKIKGLYSVSNHRIATVLIYMF